MSACPNKRSSRLSTGACRINRLRRKSPNWKRSAITRTRTSSVFADGARADASRSFLASVILLFVFQERLPMKNVVLTDRGPKPIGPYSQAIKANGFLFVSGQVALDPKTGEFVGTDIRQQTERTLENVKGILEAAGSNLHHVVKTTVFLKDINDFSAMNEVYAKFLTLAPPARSTVQVARLPKDALVEIEVIASS